MIEIGSGPEFSRNGKPVIFEKLIVCLIYGFAFLFPVCFFPYAEEIVRVPQEVLLHVFSIHIFVALILRKVELHLSSGKKYSQISNGLRTYLFLILGLNVLILPSVFLSGEPIFSLHLYKNVFFGSVIAWGVLVTFHSETRILWLLRLILWGGLVNGIYALVQHLGMDVLFSPRTGVWTFGGRVLITGFNDNSNLLGGYLAGVVPLAVIFLFAARGVLRKVFFGGCSAAALAPVLLSKTVGAFSAIVGSLILCGLWTVFGSRLSPKNKLIRIGVLGLFSLLGILMIGYTLKSRIIAENWPPISVQQRAIQWNVALHSIKENPIFGSGFGTYQTDFLSNKMEVYYRHPKSLNYEIPSQAHNDFLQFWAEAGLLPVGLALFLLGRYMRKCFGFIRTEDSRSAIGAYSSRTLVLGSLFGVIALMANSLVNFPFHVVHSAMLAVFLISISLCIVHWGSPPSEMVNQ